MLWRMRERSRTASMPKTRAVPREGEWNPSSVLLRVDFPAPLGPSRPMALPRSSPVSPSRTTRPPSLTSSRSSAITGWIAPISLPYEIVARFVPVEERAESKKIEPEQAAVGSDFNAALLAESTDGGGPGVRGQLAQCIGRFAAELLQQRVQH